MHLETDAEALRLRGVLRDLVALSAIPAMWVGRDPPAIAAGLADALVGLLQLDFAFVRLSDPSGAGAVEAARGTAWTSFPQWLEGLAGNAPFPRKEVVADVGDEAMRRRGFAVPVGVNGEGGLVAAASERSDFPTATDRLLLSLAANHAAAAFQSARLVHERKRAEEELRKARDELEVKVAERTAQLHVLAEEQAALRRVATLVAQGAAPTAVFDAVAAEMAGLLGADGVAIGRYQPQGEVTFVAHAGENAGQAPPSATVGAPIVVNGRRWGFVNANWRSGSLPPPGTEERMTQFARLLDTAIANADSRDQLTASRARLLTAADEARRRVVRDLHDGAQQRLVHTIVTLKLARRALRQKDGRPGALVEEALEQAELGNAELRELAHGILPAAVTRGGLRAGVDAVVTRLDLPIRVEVSPERFPAEIEASAYFVVAEALTNVVKHSRAEHAEVTARVKDELLRIQVRDDGVGGADPSGHGLVGMSDRMTALGGWLDVESPAGGGPIVAAALPLSGG